MIICKIVTIPVLIILTTVYVIHYSNLTKVSNAKQLKGEVINGTVNIGNKTVPVLVKDDVKYSCKKNNKTCLNKCCPMGESFRYNDEFHKECVKSKKTLQINLLPFVEGTDPKHFSIKRIFGCEILYEQRNFEINSSGVLIESKKKKKLYHHKPYKYCVERIENRRRSVVAYVCFRDDVYLEKKSVYLSLVLFFVTFFVYAISPDLRNTTHSLLLMSHTASLFLANAVIACDPTRKFPNDPGLYESYLGDLDSKKKQVMGEWFL